VILGLTGSHRYIMDYLVEEVLNNLPAPVRTFMMRTSVLERFCAPLCEAVAGTLDSESRFSDQTNSTDFQLFGMGTAQEILEYLDRTNMFLAPLDEERCWYRYHRLFADLLRSRMTQTSSDACIRDLHLRASSWFEQNELIGEAIQHALQGSDFDRAAQLVESYYTSTWEWSDVFSIRQWFNQLPQEAILRHPKLCGFYAYVEMLEGRLDGLDFYLDQAENQLNLVQKTDEYQDTLGILHLTRAYLAGYHGNWARAVEIVKHPLFTYPKYSSASHNLIGMALFLEGDLDSACELFKQLVEGDVFLLSGSVPLSESYIARIRKLQGRLKDAEQVYINTMSFISQHGWSRFYMPALIEFGLADLYREKNELETAYNYIQQALKNTGEWFPADAMATGYTVLCRILHSQGKDNDVLTCNEEAKIKLEGETLLPHIQSEFATCFVQAYLAQGKINLAGQWLRSKPALLSIPENESSGVSFREEFERVFALRVLIAEQKYQEAVELSRRMLKIATKGGRLGRVIEIGLLQAIALYHLGCCDEALSILTKSLSMAYPEGYVRLFLEEGEAVEVLLRLGRQQNQWDRPDLCGYADQLLIEFSK
jgi:LuxR family maltose regulon positive regulatory protein